MPVASKRPTRFVEQTAPLIIADGFDIDARAQIKIMSETNRLFGVSLSKTALFILGKGIRHNV